MATGAPTADELRERLGGAPGATDEELEDCIDIATAYVAPMLDPEWADPLTWPADLHDGLLLGATLTYRNQESPTSAAAGGFNPDGSPAPPPITWWPRVRQRIVQYTAAGAWVG